jgi:hypothetical protein
MSTTARKARKRGRWLAIEAAADVSDTTAGRRAFVQSEAPAFQHPRKEGTPVHLRADNQPRPYRISATISGNRPTAKARKRLADAEARSAAAAKGTPWPDHRRASRV